MDLFSVVILQCTSVTEHHIAHCLLAGLSGYDICCEPMQWESKGGHSVFPCAVPEKTSV